MVACTRHDHSEVIDDKGCLEERPNDYEQCMVEACPLDEGVWQTQKWSEVGHIYSWTTRVIVILENLL